LFIASKLDERRRRLFAAGEVCTVGGLEAVSEITSLVLDSVRTVRPRRRAAAESVVAPRGLGPAASVKSGATLIEDLRSVIEPSGGGGVVPMRANRGGSTLALACRASRLFIARSFELIVEIRAWVDRNIARLDLLGQIDLPPVARGLAGNASVEWREGCRHRERVG
jgi:hypothetical protein